MTRVTCGRVGHIAFCIPLDDFDSGRRRLAENDIGIEREIAWPDGNHSIYFRDPAGDSVELAPPTLWNSPGYESAGPVG